jgi:AcrR family transcriptional regulator
MKSERPYTQQIRQVTADMARMAAVRAAIDLLSGADAGKFSMDTVASSAGISRMTVFNMFGDKRTLLVAVYDALSSDGQLDDVTDILNAPDAKAAWTLYVQRFAQFYQNHGAVLRHLRGMAALDSDFDAVMRQRDARRDLGIAWLLQRQHGRHPGQAAKPDVLAMTQQLSALMVFEVVEALTQRAGAKRALDLWKGMLESVRCQAISPPKYLLSTAPELTPQCACTVQADFHPGFDAFT